MEKKKEGEMKETELCLIFFFSIFSNPIGSRGRGKRKISESTVEWADSSRQFQKHKYTYEWYLGRFVRWPGKQRRSKLIDHHRQLRKGAEERKREAEAAGCTAQTTRSSGRKQRKAETRRRED